MKDTQFGEATIHLSQTYDERVEIRNLPTGEDRIIRIDNRHSLTDQTVDAFLELVYIPPDLPARPVQQPVEEPKTAGTTTNPEPLKNQIQTFTTFDAKRTADLIHIKLNEYGRSHNISEINYDPELANVAMRHSIDMATNDYFGHTDKSGFDVANRYQFGGIRCTLHPINSKNENLFRSEGSLSSQPENQIATTVFDSWVKDTKYSQNLLLPWKAEGMGLVFDSNGTLYVTENFC